MITGSGDREAVFWEVRGSGTNQRLIIQWNSVHLAGAFGFAQGPLNFQAVLSERDNSIQFNYQTVTGPLLIEEGTDQHVGTFGSGQQNSPAIATDQDGNYVVVWTADGQDGDGLAIYGRLYDVDANPLTGEFQVNSTVVGRPGPRSSGDERRPAASSSSGTPKTPTSSARFSTPAGNRVGGEFLINSDPAGIQQRPEVIIDDAGNFVVTWNGSGLDDTDGVFARRFDSTGTPLGTVNEIQHLEILGPPAPSSTFTLQMGQRTRRVRLGSPAWAIPRSPPATSRTRCAACRPVARSR